MKESENEIVVEYLLDIDLTEITPEQVDTIRNNIVQGLLETITYERLHGIDDDAALTLYRKGPYSRVMLPIQENLRPSETNFKKLPQKEKKKPTA